MILVDTNILLYATAQHMPEHPRAHAWLQERFRLRERIGLPWHSLLGFVRLASKRDTFPAATTVGNAWSVVETWLARENVWVPIPTERHAAVLAGLIAGGRVTSRLVMDIHLAALAIEHGLTVCSADNDFARFPGVRWMNPLAA